MITRLVEAVLDPLRLIGSVIIPDDLCMLCAIMLHTELSVTFHFVWLQKKKKKVLRNILWCWGKKGQCGAPIIVNSTKRGERGPWLWQRLWPDTGTSLSRRPVSQWFTNNRWSALENRFSASLLLRFFARIMRQSTRRKADEPPLWGPYLDVIQTYDEKKEKC